MVFGFCLAIVLAIAISVTVRLFPALPSYLGAHKRLVQAVLFTATAFIVWVSFFWRCRRLAAFWGFVGLLLMLHTLGVWLYSTLVQPILVWQWSILLFAESYAAVPLIGWFTRRRMEHA